MLHLFFANRQFVCSLCVRWIINSDADVCASGLGEQSQDCTSASSLPLCPKEAAGCSAQGSFLSAWLQPELSLCCLWETPVLVFEFVSFFYWQWIAKMFYSVISKLFESLFFFLLVNHNFLFSAFVLVATMPCSKDARGGTLKQKSYRKHGVNLILSLVGCEPEAIFSLTFRKNALHIHKKTLTYSILFAAECLSWIDPWCCAFVINHSQTGNTELWYTALFKSHSLSSKELVCYGDLRVINRTTESGLHCKIFQKIFSQWGRIFPKSLLIFLLRYIILLLSALGLSRLSQGSKTQLFRMCCCFPPLCHRP